MQLRLQRWGFWVVKLLLLLFVVVKLFVAVAKLLHIEKSLFLAKPCILTHDFHSSPYSSPFQQLCSLT
jgi:hypothetical protein